MGTDISGYIECRERPLRPDASGTWRAAIDLDLLYGDRDYDAFGCLFGVRNYATFRPLAAGRGLPRDLSDTVRQAAESWEHHDATWISWAEVARVDWDEPAERLRATSLAHEMIHHSLLTQAGIRDGLRLKGGLAPVLRRRLMEYIDNRLAEPISLGELAAYAALSEYHFARMFRESFGMPPHQYVLARRLELARKLLRDGELPLGEIALACGFASASHFSNRFRAAVGATPGAYRAAFR